MDNDKRGRGRPPKAPGEAHRPMRLSFPPDVADWLSGKPNASGLLTRLARAEMEREMHAPLTLETWARNLPANVVVNDGADRWDPLELVAALDDEQLAREVAGTQEANGTVHVCYLDANGYQINPPAFSAELA